MQHAVAVVLLERNLEDPARVDDPDVASLRARFALSAAPTSSVSVAGRRAAREHAAPLSDDDLRAKWRTLNPDDEPPMELLPT